MRSFAAVTLALGLWTLPVHAQQQCDASMTLAECWDRFRSLADEQEVTALAEEAIQTKPTGADSFGAGFLATYKDFLPLFGGFLEFDSISEDGRAITFDINPPLEFKQLQIQTVVRQPAIFERLKQELSDVAATRDSRANALAQGLEDFDDLSLVLSYNLVSEKRGRVLALYDDLFASLVTSVDPSTALRANDERNAFLQQLAADPQFRDKANLSDFKVGEISAERQQELERRMEAAARAFAERQEALEAAFEASGLRSLAELVNNQPQLHVSAAQRWRNELVGPDTFTAKVTYERGFANVNALRKKLRPSCPQLGQGITLFDCLRTSKLSLASITDDFVTLESNDRISLSIEYSETGDYAIDLPSDDLGDAVSLDLGSSKSLVASFAYGRTLSLGTEGPGNSRFDVAISYEDVSDDPKRRDRGTASLTFTQKLSDDFSVPIAIVYANHPQFLGEVDEELSAHFGINYKLFDRKNK
jgi:hypothetical protein